jgi:hypothetical protein
MPLALTAAQQRQLDANGFTVMEAFFEGQELEALVRGVEAVACSSWGVRTPREADASQPPAYSLERAADPRDPGARGSDQGGEEHAVPGTELMYCTPGIDKVFLNLIDHERILPYVVDSLGWNIHLRDALFTPQKPFGGRGAGAGAADPAVLSAAWHFDQEEELTGVTQDGLLPLVDYKVSIYLSDHTEPGHACTMLVPGSPRWTPEQRSTWEDWLEPADVIPLRVPIGTVLLWRSTLLHAVSPHLSASPRYHLYFSYVPRWVRPSFRGVFSTADFPDPALNKALLERCSPVQRQLLGAMGDLTPTSSSLYWFPEREAQVPLKQWYEERAQTANGGIMGHGLGFSRVLAGLPGLPLDERLRAAKILWAHDSPQYARMKEGRGYRNMMNVSLHNSPGVVDRPGAWRQIREPTSDPGELQGAAVLALRTENDALKAEVAALRAAHAASGSKL